MEHVIGTRLLWVTVRMRGALLGAGCGVSGHKAAVATTDPPASTTQGSTPPTSNANPQPGTVPAITAWPLMTDKPSGVSFRLPKKPTILRPPVTRARPREGDGSRLPGPGQ